jgi:hypothetical protein
MFDWLFPDNCLPLLYRTVAETPTMESVGIFFLLVGGKSFLEEVFKLQRNRVWGTRPS